MTKNGIISLVVAGLLLLGGVMFYVHLILTSYSTPQAALKHVRYPNLKYEKFIDTERVNAHHEAFLFFHSKASSNGNSSSAELIRVAEFKKGWFGWRFFNSYGIPVTKANTNGNYIGGPDLFLGFATANISKVQYGKHSAKFIPFKNKHLKIWVIFNPKSKGSDQVQFIKK